jgi:putative transposase
LFNQWLRQELCPTLTANHVVILDNATFHKSQKTQSLIHATGAKLLYLPPYSPDLNPIERQFGVIKRYREYHAHLSLTEIINVFDSS